MVGAYVGVRSMGDSLDSLESRLRNRRIFRVEDEASTVAMLKVDLTRAHVERRPSQRRRRLGRWLALLDRTSFHSVDSFFNVLRTRMSYFHRPGRPRSSGGHSGRFNLSIRRWCRRCSKSRGSGSTSARRRRASGLRSRSRRLGPCRQAGPAGDSRSSPARDRSPRRSRPL